MPPAGRLWDGPGAARQSDTARRSAAGPGCSTCSEAACGAPDRKGLGVRRPAGTERADIKHKLKYSPIRVNVSVEHK